MSSRESSKLRIFGDRPSPASTGDYGTQRSETWLGAAIVPANRALIDMKPYSNSQSGFTLIELLVVIIILGILAALAFPAYASMVRRARYAEVRQQMGTLAREVQMYRVEQGQYPADVAGNEVPNGLKNWPQAVPFDGSYDYDHWAVGGGQCYVQIGFIGESQTRSYKVHQINAQPSEFEAFDDNLVLAIDVYDCAVASGPVK